MKLMCYFFLSKLCLVNKEEITRQFDEIFNLVFFLDWKKESITEPRPTMKISDDDLLDIGTGKQMLEDFIPKILCHSTKNEFAVGKNWALKIYTPKL